MHFDPTSGGARFQGDHDPIGGRCPTSQWEPGDIVKDTFEVVAGEATHGKGTYQVYTGLFTGSLGLWKNMKVLSEPRGPDDRVPIGAIQVD